MARSQRIVSRPILYSRINSVCNRVFVGLSVISSQRKEEVTYQGSGRPVPSQASRYPISWECVCGRVCFPCVSWKELDYGSFMFRLKQKHTHTHTRWRRHTLVHIHSTVHTHTHMHANTHKLTHSLHKQTADLRARQMIGVKFAVAIDKAASVLHFVTPPPPPHPPSLPSPSSPPTHFMLCIPLSPLRSPPCASLFSVSMSTPSSILSLSFSLSLSLPPYQPPPLTPSALVLLIQLTSVLAFRM